MPIHAKPQDFNCSEEKNNLEDVLNLCCFCSCKFQLSVLYVHIFVVLFIQLGIIEIRTNELRFLCSYMQEYPNCCVIDPLHNIYPLLDRRRIQKILLGLEDINSESCCRIRAPHFLKVFLSKWYYPFAA